MPNEKNPKDITQNNNNQGESLASSSRSRHNNKRTEKENFQAGYTIIFRYYLLKKNDWNYYFENTQELRKTHKEFPPSELDKWQKEIEEEVGKSEGSLARKHQLENEEARAFLISKGLISKEELEKKQDLILPKIGEISTLMKLPAPEVFIRSSEMLKIKETSWIVDFLLIRSEEKARIEDGWKSRHKEALEKYKEGQEKYFSSNSKNRGRAIWELYGENLAKEEVIKGLENEKLTIARMAHDYQNEVIQGLEMIKSEREKEQQENKDQTEAFIKELEKKEKEKTEIAEKSKRDIEEKQRELKKLQNSATNFIREQQAEQAKEIEVLQQQKKALESKERVELTEIKQKYEAGLAKAQNQSEEITIKNKAISDYIRLINQQENRIKILESEWKILHSKKAELTAKNYLLDNEVEKEKRERTNDKKDHEGEIRLKDDRLKDWEEAYLKWKGRNDELHETNQKKILEIRDLNKKINDLNFEKLNTANEIEKLQKAKEKGIKQNEKLNEEINKLKGGQLYQLFTKIGLKSLWAIASNGIIIAGILIFLYLFLFLWKWVIKPIIKNFRGEKKRKKRKKKVEDEIFEVEAKPVKNFSRLNSQKKTAKTKRKPKSKTK